MKTKLHILIHTFAGVFISVPLAEHMQLQSLKDVIDFNKRCWKKPLRRTQGCQIYFLPRGHI